MRARLRSIMAPMFEPAPLPDEEVQAQLRRLEARPTVLVEMANAAHGRPCDQLAREAPRIAAPVLFLHGEHDQIVPLAHARAIHDRLSCARSVHLQIVTGAGHMPHRTHPRQVASAINDWLKRQTASGRCSPNAATAEVRERQEGGSTTWKDW